MVKNKPRELNVSLGLKRLFIYNFYMKKAIYIDLDGTLLNSEYKISKKDKKYLLSIKNEWDIIISTANSFENAFQFYKELNLNTFMSTLQGQLIINPSSNKILSSELSIKDIKKILKNKKIINFLIETPKKIYLKTSKGILINKIKNDYEIFDNQKIDKILNFYIEVPKNFNLQINWLNSYEQKSRTKNKIIFFKPLNLATKLSAFNKINQYENYQFTIAIGDTMSDLECLKKANIGIAMKNSDFYVLKNFNFFSDKTNDQSGVSDILKKIIPNI